MTFLVSIQIVIVFKHVTPTYVSLHRVTNMKHYHLIISFHTSYKIQLCVCIIILTISLLSLQPEECLGDDCKKICQQSHQITSRFSCTKKIHNTGKQFLQLPTKKRKNEKSLMLSVYYSQHLRCGRICLKGYMEGDTVMNNECLILY